MSMLTPVVQAMQMILGPAPFTPADEAIMKASLADAALRAAVIRAAWQAYYGQLAAPLRVLADGVDDNIRVNRMRPIVDATVYFLFGSAPTLDLPEPPAPDGAPQPDGSDPATEAWEARLLDTLAANGWEALLLDTGINGAVAGDAYWRFLPPDADGVPHIHNLDPACMSILTDPRDIAVEAGYVWQYNTVDSRGRPQVTRVTFYRDQGGGWQISEEVQGGLWADFHLTTPPTPWPHPFCPVLHTKNLPHPNSPYGRPDVTEDLIDINRGVNFLMSNQARIIRFHSTPILWIRNQRGKKADLAIGMIINLEGPDAAVGVIAPTVDGSAAGNQTRQLDEAASEMSQTPSITLGRADQAGDPSGYALAIKAGPLIQKTRVKRTLYGPFLVEACRRLLVLLGYPGAPPRVQLAWGEVLPQDITRLGPVIDLAVQNGYMSKKSAAQRLGLDWDEELSNLAAEAAPPPTGAPTGAEGVNTPPISTGPAAEDAPLGGE